jgi:Caspase domain
VVPARRQAQRVVRLPIGDGDDGKIRATALSPNGRWLAAGGLDATDQTGEHRLTIVDLSTDAVRRYGAFENTIDHIAFSADGRRIAVGLRGKSGVRVLDSATGEELLADRDYGDRVKGLTFGPGGALITSSYDGQLRRYGPDLKLTAKRVAPDGKDPYSVAIDSTGRRVAVGYLDEPPVSVLDATTLAPLGKAQTGDLTRGDLAIVAWSRDGATLVAGGTVRAGGVRSILRRFDADGRRQGDDVALSDDTIMDIRPCGGGFAFSARDPLFGLVSLREAAATLQGPRTVDMRDKVGSALAVSPDASSVRFGLGDREEKPILFDLAVASLADSPKRPSGFITAQIDGLPVTDWEDKYDPRFRGTKLALDSPEHSRALAIRPDASGFALGTDWRVRAYDAKGKERWNRAGPGTAWGVDLSVDGEIVVVAYDDGTIRWLRWSDGEELLAFFVEPQSRKWVAWTPSGYYMASAGGEDLIGWHVNRGWNQEADFFPVSQFRAEYNRPDIVRLVLKTKDEAEAVRQANEAAHRAAPTKSVAAALPPVVTILSPVDGSFFSSGTVDITFSIRSPSGLPIDRLDVLADGQSIGTKGFKATTAAESRGHVIATMPPKDAKLTFIAYSGGLTSAPVAVALTYDGPKPMALMSGVSKLKLFALLVGVTGYTNPTYNNIHLSASDAKSVAATLKAQEGGLYGEVQLKIVDDATRDNVLDGLYWLQHAAKKDDIAVVFLSGHGFLDPEQKFWFLTREANVAELRKTAVSNDDLLDLIRHTGGKKVLFLDACHAGAFSAPGAKAEPSETAPDMNTLANNFVHAGPGIVVYGASEGKESALEPRNATEDVQWDHHSAFAEALIEAIGSGKAALNPSDPITTDSLGHYVGKRVEELTGGDQHPIMTRLEALPDFPIAVAKQ